MRYHYLFCFFFITLILTGCSATSAKTEADAENPSHITVGNILEVKNIDNRLVLLDHKETLAADGLYYISWGMNCQEDDKNNENDSSLQYDAQLYLLLGESISSEEAQHNMDTWLTAAKTNYEIVTEKEISCKEQSYSILLYDRNTTNSIYTKGISAFGRIDQNAICIELICTENFDEDLETILTDFLDNCSYSTN